MMTSASTNTWVHIQGLRSENHLFRVGQPCTVKSQSNYVRLQRLCPFLSVGGKGGRGRIKKTHFGVKQAGFGLNGFDLKVRLPTYKAIAQPW